MFHPELLLAPARKLMRCEGEPMSCQPSLVETRLLTMEISCMPQFIPVASQVNESTSAELKIQNEQRKLGLRVLKRYLTSSNGHFLLLMYPPPTKPSFIGIGSFDLCHVKLLSHTSYMNLCIFTCVPCQMNINIVDKYIIYKMYTYTG